MYLKDGGCSILAEGCQRTAINDQVAPDGLYYIAGTVDLELVGLRIIDGVTGLELTTGQRPYASALQNASHSCSKILGC